MTLALLPLGAAAIVASPDPVVLTQPDGSTVTALISGDEHHHIIRTIDGVMILRGADGFYRYAGLDAENNIAALGSVARNAELRSAAEVKEVAAIDRTSLLDRAQADRTGRLKARRNRVTSQTTESHVCPVSVTRLFPLSANRKRSSFWSNIRMFVSKSMTRKTTSRAC